MTSLAPRIGTIDFADPNREKKPHREYSAYGQSELADSLFAPELRRRLSESGSSVISTAAPAGISAANLMPEERNL
ncbi:MULTISPECIES: hypothetical protein [unclassified Nocardiopsis]|uniref:hypothetical protein n=1 Tax=unclassified Nocardiopsis TaxID=2649073 RepID=UPI001356C059|nr:MULTISPECIES: hypothetical protein [unclassified Nocardiopsis]